MRLALGLVTAAVATLRQPGDRAMLGLALGALGFALLGTMRQLELGRATLADGLPPGAEVDGVMRSSLTSLYPSSLGVAVLAAIATVLEPPLAPMLAGILVGMALATFASAGQLASFESLRHVRIYAAVDPPPRAYTVADGGRACRPRA